MTHRVPVMRLCAAAFFFNDAATTEIYSLSLHGALPIFNQIAQAFVSSAEFAAKYGPHMTDGDFGSEEHRTALKSHLNLKGRVLLVNAMAHDTSRGDVVLAFS